MNKKQYKALWSIARMNAAVKFGILNPRHDKELTKHLEALKGVPLLELESIPLIMMEVERFRWLSYSEIHSDSKWLKYADEYKDRQSGPVYLVRDSTDCDLCRVVSAECFDNRHEAKQFMQSCYDNAEGREIFSHLTEAEYKEFEGPIVDDIAARMAGY